MRILIIEDNIVTADYLRQGLKEHDFVAEIAHDGQEGLFLATNNDYAVIILDVMIPKINGWDLIQQIRTINQHVHILFLTAKDAVDDRVKGFELGADDYLVKPFAFSELLARIRSLLRRKEPHVNPVLKIADLTIDMQKHKAIRRGMIIALTAKEFMLLALFASRKGEILSRTFIAEQVWDINFDSDTNVIDVAIKRLRDKVDKNFDQKLIHSVRGIGYVFEMR